MSDTSVDIKGVLNVSDYEIQKRINFVCQCRVLGVDIPKKIDDYFKVRGIDIDEIQNEEVLVELPLIEDKDELTYYLKVSDIPKDVNTIKVSVST